MAMRYYAPFPGGGEPVRPRGPHGLRIGDAEREAAAADLGEHYAAGRLTLDELHERLDAVFSAKTFGQLTRIMADLPGSGRLFRLAGPGRPGDGVVRPGFAPGGYWGPAGIADGTFLDARYRSWPVAGPPVPDFEPRTRRPPTQSDRAGRLAALSLLLLAMLIWLFTALLFARNGLYHPVSPPVPMSHLLPANGSPQFVPNSAP